MQRRRARRAPERVRRAAAEVRPGLARSLRQARHQRESRSGALMLTGAQVMCEALIREDVRVMFGIPGGAIMPFYHAHYGYRDRLHHVLCRHEQGAGHAAEGYARASGRVGVCIATSGPGATNLVTPIADAWMDSTPLRSEERRVGK